jgi:hypothetical protein
VNNLLQNPLQCSPPNPPKGDFRIVCKLFIPEFRTPDLIMEIQGLKKIARKLTLTLAP